MIDKYVPATGIKGINKDLTFQQPDQVTFSLNTIRDAHDGGMPEYQSEPGNELVTQYLPANYILLGSIYGQNNEIYLFSTNSILSEIGLFKEGKYTTLANLNLGFDRAYPITGEYRIRNGCERVLYWDDGFNNDYWFNVDRPLDFKTSGVFDPNKFKFTPNIPIPNIDLLQVNDTGGNLDLGSYYFQVELLDNNENSLYKTDLTPQTIIFDESLSSNYNTIDGGLNTPQFDPLIGGVPNTTKSITLRFSNLDTSFKFLRVNVAYQTTANQVISAHTVGQLLAIEATSFDWTYTGFNVNAGDFQIDYSSMLIDNVNYKNSLVMEQVTNRLIRGNLNLETRSYAGYQAEAMNITAKWIAQECDAKQVTLGNPKDPNTYWYKTTFQGDEVYAFGIQYLHTDGSWSPVFHIPGRLATTFDRQLLTIVANTVPFGSLGANDVWLSDVEHLGPSYTIGTTLPRWQVFNNASIITSHTTTHPYDYEGEFAYYESVDNYPYIVDCDNNFIWGDTVDTDTNIRFHKFPDRKLIPHLQGSAGDYIVPLGVKFTVPSYPAPDIIGHRFCHIIRGDNNKTVTDSGWTAAPLDILGDGTLLWCRGRYANNSVAGIIRFESPEVLYNNAIVAGNYLKTNKIYQVHSNIIPNLAACTNFPSANSHTVYSGICYTNSILLGNLQRTNYKILQSAYLDAGATLSPSVLGSTVISYDYLTPDGLLKLNKAFDNLDIILPLVGGNHSMGLEGIEEYTLNSSYSYKKVLTNIYANLLSQQYKYVNLNPIYGTGATSLYGGDTLLSNMTTLRLAFNFGANDSGDSIFESLLDDTKWVEYFINTNMRHEGLTPESSYFERGDSDLDFLYKFWDEIGTSTNKLQARKILDYLPEYYKYNMDYDLQSNQKGKFSIPFNYNYCDLCLGRYPTRLIFSPVSFDQERLDLYRQVNTNDYVDLPGHTGAITGLKFLNNRLIVHTEHTTYILQPNPQQIQTDQNTAYLGTGDFLSIPPQELMQTNIGYAGCQSKQHQCDTPYGHCWIDQKRGELFKFDQQLSKIDTGLINYLREELPSELQTAFYPKYNYEYPTLVTTHTDGVGCILYYDPRFKRLLLTKIDYQPINLLDESTLGTHNYDSRYLSGRWQDGITGVPITFGANRYFINKSWTLSYNFDYQSFNGWHSYRPYNAFSDSNNYFTLNRFSNQIWRHKHKELYQNYYGIKYDMIMEYQVFDIQTSRLQAIHYVGYTYGYDTGSEEWTLQNKTFDRAIVYNNNQSSGLQTITLSTSPYDNTFLTGNTKYAIKKDQNYKIAGFRDVSTNQPVMTRLWDNVQLYSGYIDKVPNTINIDFNKSGYESGQLWDKFVNIRLFFKPTEDYKKVILLNNINELQSIR